MTDSGMSAATRRELVRDVQELLVESARQGEAIENLREAMARAIAALDRVETTLDRLREQQVSMKAHQDLNLKQATAVTAGGGALGALAAKVMDVLGVI